MAKKGILAETMEFSDVLHAELVRPDGDATVKSVAWRMGMPEKTLYSYVEGARPFPLDKLVPLCRASGNDVFLRYFAEQLGLLIFAVPACDCPEDLAVLRQVVATQREQLQAVEATLAALADGRIDAAEAPRVRRELREAVTALLRLDALVDACAEARR